MMSGGMHSMAVWGGGSRRLDLEYPNDSAHQMAPIAGRNGGAVGTVALSS